MTDRPGKPMVPDTYEHVTTREWLAHQRRADSAEAECERLRATLKRITDLDGHPTVPVSDRGDFAVQIARDTLGEADNE